jgi:hypothetical protein
MGRRYKQELEELALTRARVPERAAKDLGQAALAASASGLIVVASGGAKVVAEWACRLHRLAFGSAAVALTPLEYAAMRAPVRAMTWLVSSGGRHPDIREAANAAKLRGDGRVVGILGQANTPLEHWLSQESLGSSITLQLPGGADGFLATNSVWSMACTLARAYAPFFPEDDSVDLTESTLEEVLRWAKHDASRMARNDALNKELVLIHDVWSALGAQDLETRLIEASLSNVWISDFRNFGHGRHYWIADRTERSAVLALWTPAADGLAEQSLAQLPDSLHLERVRVPYEGLLGALASLAWSIHATDHWADALDRDPGRPGVPPFGERLYEGGFPYPKMPLISQTTWAISRKHSGIVLKNEHVSVWKDGYRRALAHFDTATISAVVMDFDGTLIESAKRYEPLEQVIVTQLHRLLEAGIWIGIATGRGDSVQTSLQDAIPQSLRSRILVGYHNGAQVSLLDHPVEGLDDLPTDPTFKRVCEVLERELQVTGLATLRIRAKQLTLTPTLGLSLDDTWRAAKDSLSRQGLDQIGIWLSSHSVDVVATNSSKLRVVDQIADLAGCSTSQVLRIGDRGAWPGNDWELLSGPLSLSVDECSSDLESCWNLVLPGLRGPKATAYLLAHLEPTEGGMQLMLQEHEL